MFCVNEIPLFNFYRRQLYDSQEKLEEQLEETLKALDMERSQRLLLQLIIKLFLIYMGHLLFLNSLNWRMGLSFV